MYDPSAEQPDDPIVNHPMWEEQVFLEEGMLRRGGQDVRDRVAVATARGQMTRINCVQGLLDDWLPPLAKGLRDWVNEQGRSRGGPKPLALAFLKEADEYVAMLIALRAILDGIATERVALVGLACEIGRTLEHEEQMRHWAATEKGLYRAVQRELIQDKSTGAHRKRVNINRFNSLLKQGTTKLDWKPWGREAQFRCGIALIDIVVRYTQWFEVGNDPEHHARHGVMNRPKLVLAVRPEMMDWLGRALVDAEVSNPTFRPTVVPPKQWTSSRDGGYWTPFVRTPRLVRFKASQEDQKDRAADEYDAIDMPMVYDAVHLLQETGYRVNEEVLEVMVACAAQGLAIGKLPPSGNKELPPRTPRMEEHMDAVLDARINRTERPLPDLETEAEIAAWKKLAAPIWKFNAKRVSRMRGATRTMLCADDYRAYLTIYFPHMLDFRGRAYPVPSGLQPQGDDLARGLLKYDTKLPVTEANGGLGWIKIGLASAFGVDKVSYDERIEWVDAREADWRAVALDPMGNRDLWAGPEGSPVDDPWAGLAAIFELVRALDHGEGYESDLIIYVDGTCNGIQHLSAMLRDVNAGTHVNLVPGPKPKDIYKHVAIKLQADLEGIVLKDTIASGHAEWWLEFCEGELPRSLTKRQVMVLPYGGTRDSFFTYTRKWLDEKLPVTGAEDDDERKLRTDRIVFLAGRMWDVVNVEVSAAMKVMEWLQKCAKAVCEVDQPIFWTTPSGMVVRHFYGKQKERQVKITLDGEVRQLRTHETTAELDTKEQLQGISPNFVHSLDASCMVECARRCREAGITHFSSIHDAYGTHAANMWPLHQFLREAFVETHSHDNLAMFRNSCARVLMSKLVTQGVDPMEAGQIADEMMPKPLELGDLDINVVLQSDYFFA